MQLLLLSVLAQAPAQHDTVLMRMVAQPVSGFQQVVAVAEAGAVLIVYVLVIAAVWAAIRLRSTLEGTRASLEAVGRDLRELADNANRISRSVSEVATSVQTDLASVRETVDYANRRARHAVTVLADRVDEFNDAIGVVQADTQNVVFSALAALKGVRAGLGALRRGKKGRNANGARRSERELADDDGDTPADLAERPRLRRRAPAKR